MSPKERKGASGTISLSYDWEESASSHWDSLETVELLGDEDYVILQVHYKHSNELKRTDAVDRTTKYRLKTQDLIDHIKAKGELLK